MPITRRTHLVLPCFLLGGIVSSAIPAEDTAAPSKPKRFKGKVLIVGDSLTAGDGVNADVAFPAVLDRFSDDYQIISQGRSGWPTSAYLRRIDEVLKTLPTDAEHILIQLGANDLRVNGHEEEAIRQAAKNMRRLTLIFREHASHAKITWIAPPTMVPNELTDRLEEAGFGEHSPAWIERLGQAYVPAAARVDCGVIDLFPVLKPGDTVDGAHPNAAGHRKLAATIAEHFAVQRKQQDK
jgi:lysophospholipase L1-like esterase